VTTVIVSPYHVASFPEGGGHFWVYMQYVLGLRQLGCQVYWLEKFSLDPEGAQGKAALQIFSARMQKFDLQNNFILYNAQENSDHLTYVGRAAEEVEAIFRQTDLLINFHYAAGSNILGRFKRTALVDIDPGLLQFWISHDQLHVQPHDLYFTIGETVGTPRALFPDCGLTWDQIRPIVNLEAWPFTYRPEARAFTSISTWEIEDWIVGENEAYYENSKRINYLRFADLPQNLQQELELALYLTDNDDDDRNLMEKGGWKIRISREVAGTPEQYQAYIQDSRGEFSVVKPSCIFFQNAWMSDRSLCYLASGKPVVVQNTGPSLYLPDGEGLLRFSTTEEAITAIEAINRSYPHHCKAAREMAEEYFDSQKVLAKLLNRAI
jgi:hypothetical protein